LFADEFEIMSAALDYNREEAIKLPFQGDLTVETPLDVGCRCQLL
jgi:hypothetical protein